MGLSFQEPVAPQLVPYMDLGGGLNTRLDPHALQRNELAISQNLWSSYDQAIAKRPGTTALNTGAAPPNGGTGAGTATISLCSARFSGITWLILCDTKGQIWVLQLKYPGPFGPWRHIGNVNVNAAFITTAQMFDPSTQMNSVFICDGLSTPQIWQQNAAGAIATTLVSVGTGVNQLPFAYNTTSAHITPQYVKTLGNNSHLFYSGEPTNKSAVYVSDPFYPQSFTTAAMQVGIDPLNTQYFPAIIGNNDGVNGGDITGLESLGSAMIVFKVAAVYVMLQTTLLGEVPAWQVMQVSSSTGNVAPRSIAGFSQFVAFLSVDGVYYTDGQMVQKISTDVPTYFDSSLDGNPALISNRANAIGVRHGNRYELFFPTLSASYCNTGVWFDFDKQSRFGSPLAGEIDGMNVGGAVALRGGLDDGNVAWGDALKDQVGIFGQGFADFGNPISTLFAGKADMFEDIFGPEEIASRKQMQDAYLLVQVLNVSTVTSLDFYGMVNVDLSKNYPRVIIQPDNTQIPGGEWGANQWGVMNWGAAGGSNFGVVKIPMQNGARGYLLQIAIKESSTVPWIVNGYGCYVNMGRPGY